MPALTIGLERKIAVYAMLLIAVTFEVLGDLLFRKWGIEQRWPVFAASLIIYNLGAIAWGISLRFMQVSTGIIVLGILNVVFVVIGGAVIFKERITPLQTLGIALGLVSLILVGGGE